MSNGWIRTRSDSELEAMVDKLKPMYDGNESLIVREAIRELFRSRVLGAPICAVPSDAGRYITVDDLDEAIKKVGGTTAFDKLAEVTRIIAYGEPAHYPEMPSGIEAARAVSMLRRPTEPTLCGTCGTVHAWAECPACHMTDKELAKFRAKAGAEEFTPASPPIRLYGNPTSPEEPWPPGSTIGKVLCENCGDWHKRGECPLDS